MTKEEMWNKAILKINHLLFWWYYKRVPRFFRQWPMLKSISLLRQNYEQQLFINKGKDEIIANSIIVEDKLRKELAGLKMKIVLDSDTIDHINKTFGTDFGKNSDN